MKSWRTELSSRRPGWVNCHVPGGEAHVGMNRSTEGRVETKVQVSLTASRLGSAFQTLSKLLQISGLQFHHKWIWDFYQRTAMAPSSMESLFREWSLTWRMCSPPTALVPARLCPVIPALSPGECGLSIQIQKIMLWAATTSWWQLAPNLKCIHNLFFVLFIISLWRRSDWGFRDAERLDIQLLCIMSIVFS